jgi:hypothetical protein
VVRRHSTSEFGLVLSTTIEGRIDWHFLFSNGSHFYLWWTSLASSTWSGTEDCGFAEAELKPAQEDGVEVIGFDGRVDGDPIAGTIACLATLNDESDAVLNDVTSFGPGVNGPRRVKLVLVDDDLRGGRNDGGLVASEEPSGSPR